MHSAFLALSLLAAVAASPSSDASAFAASGVQAVADALSVAGGDDPTYDHQSATYNADRKPVTTDGDLTVMPFFSPDNSLETIVNVILGAKATVDVGTPGFSSWIGCTGFDTGPIGCPAAKMRNETFPVFPALLNALHRGIKVRIVTNYYNTPAGPGLLEPLSFLRLAGAEVMYYTSTTFMHAKYVCADCKDPSNAKAAVSSVNYSKTSLTKNREAGVVVSGPGSSAAIGYWTGVFEADLSAGKPWPLQQYNSSVMAVVTDPSILPVVIPKPEPMCDTCYSPKLSPVKTSASLSTTTSPDSAFDFITTPLNATKSSLELMIYQITDQTLCNILQELHQKGVNVTILVSKYIYDDFDWKAAQVCYGQLHGAGLTIQRTYASSYYMYSHQKFWIVDGETLFMSTGNWSPSDYPSGSAVFPPYGSSSWRRANRDFTVSISDPDVVAQFRAVFDNDYAVGSQWQPSGVTAALRASAAPDVALA